MIDAEVLEVFRWVKPDDQGRRVVTLDTVVTLLKKDTSVVGSLLVEMQRRGLLRLVSRSAYVLSPEGEVMFEASPEGPPWSVVQNRAALDEVFGEPEMWGRYAVVWDGVVTGRGSSPDEAQAASISAIGRAGVLVHVHEPLGEAVISPVRAES